MKKTNTLTAVVAGLTAILFCAEVKAGNPSRNGQAGASEILIDPWAGTSGFAGANTSCVQGIESQFLNVAGLAFTQHTEVILGNTDYLAGGAGINLAMAGLSQHIGGEGVIGLSIVSMNFGNIPITTYDNPDGGVGYYTPQFINIGLSYARKFSEDIYGGVTTRLISESISNASALGIGIDAGIQYVHDLGHGKKNLHFGIALKNVGPPMKFSGDGLAYEVPQPNSSSSGATVTMEERSQAFELPSLVNIGAAYDIRPIGDSSRTSPHRITIAANFTSNAFTQDEEEIGVEYGYKSFFAIRVGLDYQKGIFNPLTLDPVNSGGRLTVFTGPCAGFTLNTPSFGKNKTTMFGISYAYRATNPYSGCHTISVRMSL